jgi:signal transduction histidine kinase
MHATLEREWSTYTQLPTYPDERERWPVVRARLDRVTHVVDAALRELAAGNQRGASTLFDREVMPASDSLDQAFDELVRINADTATRLADRIGARRRQSWISTLLLTAISAVLQLVAAALAIRTVSARTRELEERADELEMFAGRIAHDVLGPLSGRDMALQVLGDQPTPDRLSSLAPRMRSAVRRVRQLADGLLAFARSGARPTDTISRTRAVLPDLIAELHAEAAESQIVLDADPVPDLELRCADGVLISIVGNLVHNAIKYMGDRVERRVELRFHPTDGWLRIEVQDSGPGIPPDLGDRIFEPFTRGLVGRTPGAGLGLATVKRLVTAHGGRIDVRSQPGAGAGFGVELPCAPHPA